MTKADAPGALFSAFAKAWRPAVEQALDRILPDATEPPTALHAAMRHAVFPGGKRLRPMLALLAARATGGEPTRAVTAAAGLECLHAYSLVHDDLPCMDDDELRRGRPTVHVAFGEATAVLAGDALQTLAFEAVASAGADAVMALCRAAGSHGMVGGQAGDLAAEGRGDQLPLEQLEWIHDQKTGALIAASLEVGAIAGRGRTSALADLRTYGRLCGRAFQIADDCLDVTGTTAELGKRPGQDRAHSKSTYPALLGIDESLECARELARQAAALAPAVCGVGPGGAHRGSALDAEVRLLQDVALYSVARKT